MFNLYSCTFFEIYCNITALEMELIEGNCERQITLQERLLEDFFTNRKTSYLVSTRIPFVATENTRDYPKLQTYFLFLYVCKCLLVNATRASLPVYGPCLQI